MEGATARGDWDDQAFKGILERVRTEGTIDAENVRISSERLERVLEAAPKDPDRPGRPLLKHASFVDVSFTGRAGFIGVTFQGAASFAVVTFQDAVSFYDATFQGAVWFRKVIFERQTVLRDASFQRDASFVEVTFQGDAFFDGATFQGEASFVESTFESDAWFDNATFLGDGSFHGETFRGDASFRGATFQRDASFAEATFEGARDVGPLVARGALDLERTDFAQRISIEARALSCSTTQFRRGADLLVGLGEVALDDADFAEPSMLAPRPEPVRGEETTAPEPRDSGGEPAPRVVSMRGAKVANLTIAGADLRPCRFEGAYGLDQLHLERVRFAETPSGWQRTKRWPLPIRWTRRQAIAEEHQWRAERAGATGWYGPEVQATSDRSAPLAPEQIATIYRALRKGREDRKDEPGAADFYYGEMEMRRQGPFRHEGKSRPGDSAVRPTPKSERLILWLYWLVSGYGLRASRALIALAVTVVVFAFLFDWWGFRPDRGFGRTLLFSIESTSSLFRVPETEGFALTAGGEVLQVVLRLLGPLFFGLALLSLRGRVKR
jgi:uncharacterized protein YjbI with pentapeptide repeats